MRCSFIEGEFGRFEEGVEDKTGVGFKEIWR